MKLKKLEFKINREKDYIKLLDRQKLRKQEIIQNIEYKIEKETKKLEHSLKKNKKDSESLVSSEKSMSMNNISLESKSDIENGFEILVFTISKNISSHKLEFFHNFIEKIEERKIKKI